MKKITFKCDRCNAELDEDCAARTENGIADLMFKTAADRGADQYKDMSLDTYVSVEEAVTMYRIITGACRQGSESFVESLGNTLKERYTIRECLEVTKGQYGYEAFARFFEELQDEAD